MPENIKKHNEDMIFKQAELGFIAEKTGMRPTAVSDLCLHVAELEVVTGDDGVQKLIHTETQQNAFDAVNVFYRQNRPHWFPSAAEPDLLERCFGNRPSLTAQGELVRAIGEREAQERAAQYGTKLGTLKPGRAPDSGEPVPEKKPSTNPWSAEGNTDANGRYTAAALRRQANVCALGVPRATAIAASVGSFVGAVGPKSKRLIAR